MKNLDQVVWLICVLCWCGEFGQSRVMIVGLVKDWICGFVRYQCWREPMESNWGLGKLVLLCCYCVLVPLFWLWFVFLCVCFFSSVLSPVIDLAVFSFPLWVCTYTWFCTSCAFIYTTWLIQKKCCMVNLGT